MAAIRGSNHRVVVVDKEHISLDVLFLVLFSEDILNVTQLPLFTVDCQFVITEAAVSVYEYWIGYNGKCILFQVFNIKGG
jgi:hypothetical protein